ncbi:MAG: hypothetical protein ABII90_00225 [Bacteroidota bacterium]
MITNTYKTEIRSIFSHASLTLRISVVAGLIAVFSSCGSDQDEQKIDDKLITSDEEFTAGEIRVKKVGKVFYSIPSPIEMTSLIKKAGGTYDKDILNSAGNVSNYITNKSMALNLGIYGADLSYSSIYDQTQETMLYFSAAKKLADGLGISSAFGKSIWERVENNLSNRDSLVQIISDSYWETDAYLKENRRSNTSALVITGGWIEGLYIGTKLATSATNNQEIISRIGEQKLTLNNLIAMLETYDDEGVADILEELLEVQQVFDGVELSYTRKEPDTNPETKVTTLFTTSKISISEEQLDSISVKIKKIRDNIIK